MPLDAAVCRKVTEKVLTLRVLVDKYRRITLDADTLDNSIPATGTTRTRPERCISRRVLFDFLRLLLRNVILLYCTVLRYPNFDPLQFRKTFSILSLVSCCIVRETSA